VPSLATDLRWSFRFLRRNPLFATVVVTILAVGIGANTAVFSFVSSFLLSEPPVAEPHRLVRVFPQFEGGIQYGNFSVPEYEDLRERNSTFADLVTESLTPLHLSQGDRRERVWGSVVSANYFSALGVPPARGRGFLPEEAEPAGGHPVVVLSHAFWSRLGADPTVVGSTILVNNSAFTVVGVAPEGFRGTNVGLEPDLWAPLSMRRTLVPGTPVDIRGSRWLMFTFGRLRPGVTLAQAEADCNAVLARLREEHPDRYARQRYRLYPESQATLHPASRGPITAGLGALGAVLGAVLLLVCANVAGLLLARGATRGREMGIRLALGARRRHITRQLLTESVVLALIGGVLGVGVAYVLVELLASLEVPTNLPIQFRASVDPGVLMVTAAVSVAVGILCGLAPSLRLVKQSEAFSVPRRIEGGRGTGRLLGAFTIGQLALSTALLATAGLAIQSLRNAARIDPGFEAEGQLLASVNLDLQGYERPEGRQFVRDLRTRVSRLPGVETVGISSSRPLTVSTDRTGVRPANFVAPDDFNYPAVEYNIVDSGYLSAMGIPLLRGRGFLPEENEEVRRVVVINEALARIYWADENPVGEQVWIGMGGDGFRVVGVVATTKYHGLSEPPTPGIYLPFGAFYSGEINIHVRTTRADPATLAPSLRRELHALDPTLPVQDLETMASHLGFAMLPARLTAGSVSSFAGLALVLAVMGLYGILALSVRRQTRPLGIRMALGATPARILALVLRRGLALTVAGVAIGLVLAAGLTRALSSLLYGVAPVETGAFAGAVAVLLVAAGAAILIPAYRAVRVDPVRAINVE
jgi:predicted permease